MPLTGYHHTGITVTDLTAALTFYRDVLGLQVVTERRIDEDYAREFIGVQSDAVNVAFLELPGTGALIELLEYEDPERRPAGSRPPDPGNVHICLVVDDLDALFSRLKAAGFGAQSPAPVAIPVGPNAGGKILYAIGPDGVFVELLQRPVEAAT